jgi:hypothetical protein
MSNTQKMRILNKGLTRRQFMTHTTAAVAGISVFTAGGLLAVPRSGWAAELDAIAPNASKTLVLMARDIFPHDRFSDAIYARAVEAYGPAAEQDPTLRKLLADGIAALDAAAMKLAGKAYADLANESDRLKALWAIEGSQFFGKIRGDLVVSLYNQPEVWAKLGYEGSSWEKGGYINRGFSDIDWL